MFSAGISDAVRAFKTSGSGMAQAIQNLGASATTAQVPLEEQLSVLGMLQATMGGAEAGTKYKAFLRSATKGGEALGLKFTDVNNQLLSMPEILDILRGKFGETMDAAEKMELQKAFGDTEAVALIDLMYNKVGDLQDNIVNMYGSLGKGVSVTEQMASAIQETEPERFERLKQRIHNVTESIGNSLLPTVNDLMSKGEGVLTKVGPWIEKNQELVKVIMLIVLAVGGSLRRPHPCNHRGGGAMTGLNDTDIRLNSEWQLTQATDGDAPLCSGLECLYQNIVLEALTQPGDVFYDAEFGWGLYDFIQSEDTELTRLEITQRVRLKLQKREVILPESIEISIAFEDDAVVLHCSFRFAEEDERRELDVIIGAVSVEVVSE